MNGKTYLLEKYNFMFLFSCNFLHIVVLVCRYSGKMLIQAEIPNTTFNSLCDSFDNHGVNRIKLMSHYLEVCMHLIFQLTAGS